MPSHSSHILQPLDVVCFSPLKHKYSERIRGLARNRVFHISKENFLPAFKDAFFDVFTEENCRKAFEATAIVRTDAQTVIDRLDIRLCTPPQQLLPEALWESRTPSNSHEFGSQSRLISSSFLRSPPEAKEGFSQLVKGAELMLHQNVLQSARITELEEQLAVLTRRRSRKRKRIQQGGAIEYGIGALQAAADTGTSAQQSKRSRDEAGREGALPTQRRCRNCGIAGHNARTCQQDRDAPSELLPSIADV